MKSGTISNSKNENMFKIKTLVFIALVFSSIANFGQHTDVINSNRPGKSMSAFAVGNSVFQTELGFYGLHEKHDLSRYEINGFGSDLSIRYGAILEQLEFVADLQYQQEWYRAPLVNQVRSGLKQTIIGAKYLIYDPYKNQETKVNVYSWKANHQFKWRQLIPAVAIYAGANINLIDDKFSRPFIPVDPKISPKIAVITQHQFGKYVLLTNIILDKFPFKKKSIDYVITLTRGFSSRWSGFLENQGYKGDYYSDGIFRGGLAFLANKNIQIDASMGTNYKNTPSILMGGIGFSWRFDANHRAVLLAVPN